jgi:hypothetical protein
MGAFEDFFCAHLRNPRNLRLISLLVYEMNRSCGLITE